MNTLRMSFLAGVAPCIVSCATAPRNPVLDKYPAGVEGRTSVVYYDIHGRTYAELRDEMRRLGPKTSEGSFVGETRSPMSWSWRTESVTGSGCTMRDVRVRVNAEILLPRWTPAADVDSSLVTEWKRFIAALETHEAGHKDISARAGRDLKDQLRELTGLCSQVGMRADDIARRITDAASAAQRRYDAETRHGLTQGTTFGPASFIANTVRPDSAAARVMQLLVRPGSLELAVGDNMSAVDLFRRFEVRGITARGDTLRAFSRTFLVEPNERLVRSGSGFLARAAGDANVWILVGSQPQTEMRESARSVRVPVHIR